MQTRLRTPIVPELHCQSLPIPAALTRRVSVQANLGLPPFRSSTGIANKYSYFTVRLPSGAKIMVLWKCDAPVPTQTSSSISHFHCSTPQDLQRHVVAFTLS